MYVVELTNGTASTVGQVPANSIVFLPADRCQWQQSFVKPAGKAGGYDINNVRFYDGSSAGGFSYNGLAARLGFVAKTGRFVAITD